MKTFIYIISALAAVALAAPYPGEEQFTSDPHQGSPPEINEREKKSADPHIKLLGLHSGPQIIDKNSLIVNKPIFIKKKTGYHLFRSSDAEQADSQENCSKQIKVKLCNAENSPQAKDALKSTTIEDMNIHLVGDDMTQSIKMAKEAVENLQRDLKNIDEHSNDETQRANFKSAELHEDIEIARQALEQVHNNFGNLESFSLVAPATDDLMKEASLKSLTEEDERIAKWQATNIHKDVEVARNIEENTKSASENGEKLAKEVTQKKDETQEKLNSSNDNAEKSELSQNTKEEKKGSDDIVAVSSAQKVENVKNKSDMTTSASETKESLVDSKNTSTKPAVDKLVKENMDKMTEQELVDYLLNLTDKSHTKSNEKSRWAESNPLKAEQTKMAKIDMNKMTEQEMVDHLLKLTDKSHTKSNEKSRWAESNPLKAEQTKMAKIDMNKMTEQEMVDHLLKLTDKSHTKSNEKNRWAESNSLQEEQTKMVKTDKDTGILKSAKLEEKMETNAATVPSPSVTDTIHAVESRTQEKQETHMLPKADFELASKMQESQINHNSKIEKAAIPENDKLMHTSDVSKTKSFPKESSMFKSAHNIEILKNENTAQKTNDMLKSALATDIENLNQPAEIMATPSHHQHHHHEISEMDVQKAATEENSKKMIEVQGNIFNKNENQLLTEPNAKSVMKSANEETMSKINEKLKEAKDDLMKDSETNHAKMELKAASIPELQEINQPQKHVTMGKSADSELEIVPAQQHHHHHHQTLHQKSSKPQLHEQSQFHRRNNMNADKHSMMKHESHLSTSFDGMDHVRNAQFGGHPQMAERGSHVPGRMNLMPHSMDSAMQPSMQMNSMVDPMSKSAMEYNSMQWKHGAKSSSYGPSEAGSGSSGAVGVFPNANVGNCAIPLLLSCNPSVVSGSLAKPHSSYSAPSYRAGDNFNYLKKRDVKVSSLDNLAPVSRSKSKTLFKNTSNTNQKS